MLNFLAIYQQFRLQFMESRVTNERVVCLRGLPNKKLVVFVDHPTLRTLGTSSL